MNDAYLYTLYQNFLEQILDPFFSAAITTNDGQALYIKYESLVDIGTFPIAAETSHRYLQLQDGDIVITNDPYSGGSTLSSITMITGLCTGTSRNKKEADILIACRIPFKPHVKISKSVDEEGIRIPPTPLYINKQLNKELLQAIKMHPQCPPRFEETLSSAAEQLNRASHLYKTLAHAYDFNFSKKDIKKFLAYSQKMTKNLINDITIGETHCELTLEKNCKLKLKLENNDDRVIFDFSGSDASANLHLTDAATFGACAGALTSLFKQNVPLNSGVFACIDVVAPKGTAVNAQYPKPVFEGMTDGAGIIANLALKAFGIIDRNKQMALSGTSQCSFEIEFNETDYFYETLETGAPATADKHGTDGLSLWRRSHLNPCIEEVERRYPIRINSYSFRLESGGSGAKGGGDGVTKSITALAPGKLKWLITDPIDKPEGVRGGKMASSSEIFLQNQSGERSKQELRGETQLTAGDTVILSSAGGGGYGEPVLEE